MSHRGPWASDYYMYFVNFSSSFFYSSIILIYKFRAAVAHQFHVTLTAIWAPKIIIMHFHLYHLLFWLPFCLVRFVFRFLYIICVSLLYQKTIMHITAPWIVLGTTVFATRSSKEMFMSISYCRLSRALILHSRSVVRVQLTQA